MIAQPVIQKSYPQHMIGVLGYITIYDQLPAKHPIPRATKLTMFQLDDRLMVFEGSSNIDNKNGQKKWPLLSGVTWAPINGGNSGETKPYL